jgi:hypothetical protein
MSINNLSGSTTLTSKAGHAVKTPGTPAIDTLSNICFHLNRQFPSGILSIPSGWISIVRLNPSLQHCYIYLCVNTWEVITTTCLITHAELGITFPSMFRIVYCPVIVMSLHSKFIEIKSYAIFRPKSVRNI